MRILILPGDGIGPEIMAANKSALEAINEKLSLGLRLEVRDIGFNSFRNESSTFPQHILEAAKDADGTILGPVSTFEYPPKEEGGVSPSSTLRLELDLYANIRPSKTRPNIPSLAKNMDILIVRENTEGFYADRNMYVGLGEFMPTEDIAMSIRKITRHGSQRIAFQAFKLSMRRRKKVTVIHKANVLKISDGLFLSVVKDVAKNFPEVEVESLIVDAAAAHIIRRPEEFDVILTTNMYGDILSDEAAELSGGLGLGGSINVGDAYGIAQAAHGSAPDIQGQNIANPSALMFSTAMLLDWLGKKHKQPKLTGAAKDLENAVESALSDPQNHTPDLGGSGTTKKFGEAVFSEINN